MFSKVLEQSIKNAYSMAESKSHEYVTLEHLLLTLLSTTDIQKALQFCGADTKRLEHNLLIYVDETTPKKKKKHDDIIPTISFQRVIQQSVRHSSLVGDQDVDSLCVLICILDEQTSHAAQFLEKEHIIQSDIIDYIAQTELNDIALPDQVEPVREPVWAPDAEPNDDAITNLNEQARAGKIDPLIGRDNEIERVMQTLCRRRKNNPLLVGEAGVGKTAIASAIAQCIVNKSAPEILQKSTLYSLDMGALLAGTKHRGDFEKRIKDVFNKFNSKTHSIVFIDEIHTIVGAGSTGDSNLDAANLLKPLLSSSTVQIIGATTYDEYRKYLSKDSALVRRFQPVDVEEPNDADTMKILNGIIGKYESFHRVKYNPKSLERAIALGSRYLHDRHMPDKAIDIIDEAGTFISLQNGKSRVVEVSDIDHVVSEMAHIPLEQIQPTDKKHLKQLASNLKKQIFEQDDAINILSNSIVLSKAGLRDLNKPIGSFLMIGPTGVGKTELTLALAKELGLHLIRFDMSEYMEKHSVSRLIGSPPGYVGYEQGGQLSEMVVKHPHSILLLDEIEKAHPDIYNILLQIMDYGFLTDNNGRKIDFRHVLIIMTSNAGADLLEKNTMGFHKGDYIDESMKSLNRLFTPEFRNRLDAIVQFKHLSETAINRIIDKSIDQLRDTLKKSDIDIELTAPARRYLIEHGYDRIMGARPIQRLIEDQIKKPLAEEILFGEQVDSARRVVVRLVNGVLSCTMDSHQF